MFKIYAVFLMKAKTALEYVLSAVPARAQIGQQAQQMNAEPASNAMQLDLQALVGV